MTKSTQTTVLEEEEEGYALCSADGRPHTAAKWGRGGHIQNIRFFLLWAKFPLFLHRDLGGEVHATSPTFSPQNSPQPNLPSSVRVEVREFPTRPLPQGVRFHRLPAAFRENVLPPTKITQRHKRGSVFSKSYRVAL